MAECATQEHHKIPTSWRLHTKPAKPMFLLLHLGIPVARSGRPLMGWKGIHCRGRPCMCRCLCNAKPRKFDLSNKLIMGNMADLVVRELWGAYEHQHKQRVMQLIRVVGCYSEPLLFVEVSQTQPWMVLHLNEAAVTVTGEQSHPIPQGILADMYLPSNGQVENSSQTAVYRQSLHSCSWGFPLCLTSQG